MKPKGLRTKLNFRFGVDDIEIPEMNFESDEPKEKESTEIQTYKKKKRSSKKSSEKLF